MSNSISSGAFATFNANNSHLYNSSRSAFAIHQNNRFIKVKSPKVSRWLTGQKLSPEQMRLLKSKISYYAAKERQGVVINAVVTLLISAGVLVMTSELLNYHM